MCKKCLNNPDIRNTRYCDDWWDDIPHGGYKKDRERKEWSIYDEDDDAPDIADTHPGFDGDW